MPWEIFKRHMEECRKERNHVPVPDGDDRGSVSGDRRDGDPVDKSGVVRVPT